MSKQPENLYGLVGELVQELINMGYDEQSLIYILGQYGITEDEAKEWYGIPYEEDEEDEEDKD